jgi:hypothetical protein
MDGRLAAKKGVWLAVHWVVLTASPTGDSRVEWKAYLTADKKVCEWADRWVVVTADGWVDWKDEMWADWALLWERR